MSSLEANAAVGIVIMHHQRRDLMEIYVEWLYFGFINPLAGAHDNVLARLKQLFDLYVLADMLQDEVFANAVMDTLLKETDAQEMWPTSFAALTWTELPDTSPMRKYIKDIWVARSFSTWFDQPFGDVMDAPKDFWVEVAKLHTLVREKKEKVLKPSYATRCKYHTHNDSRRCA